MMGALRALKSADTDTDLVHKLKRTHKGISISDTSIKKTLKRSQHSQPGKKLSVKYTRYFWCKEKIWSHHEINTSSTETATTAALMPGKA